MSNTRVILELLEVAEEMLSAVACFGKATIPYERWERAVIKAKKEVINE